MLLNESLFQPMGINNRDQKKILFRHYQLPVRTAGVTGRRSEDMMLTELKTVCILLLSRLQGGRGIFLHQRQHKWLGEQVPLFSPSFTSVYIRMHIAVCADEHNN